jgi:hypothetical protein
MPRVSDPEVKAIIETDDTDLAPYIYAASAVVDKHLLSQGVASETLKEIERWLAAHFLAAKEQQAAQESYGNSSATYQGQTGLGLDGTQYGQRAKLIDPTGNLARASLDSVEVGLL